MSDDIPRDSSAAVEEHHIPNMANNLDDEWQVAKRGIVMWLNNDPVGAESFLKSMGLDSSVQVLASYTFISVINGVISYELDKMELAQKMLRELEQRCATNNSTWLHSIRSIIFRGGAAPAASEAQPNTQDTLVQRLEHQIVLADVALCSAILTFLTQDVSGMMRGSWLLKRAWKIYSSVYQQIYQLYRDSLADEDADVLNNLPRIRHSSSNGSCATNSDWSITSSESQTAAPPPSATRKGLVQSFSDFFLSTAAGDENKNKKWRRKSKKNKMPRSKSSPEDTNKLQSEAAIDPQVIHRLMGAISFGYGAFKLAVSLLPPSMLKLVSFFGFEGDREVGLSCLQFSRTTTDMRSPLSTIALLWYLTVGNQIFASEGSDSEAANENNIAQVTAILRESENDFADSALFGFFRGRLQRMHKDMPGAIEHFERAYYTSVLPELRLLCLHEMGWCRIIDLDCLNAIDEFHALKINSEYSKSFFGYLCTICHGVANNCPAEQMLELRRDIVESIAGSNSAASPQRDQSQIDQFISKRLELIPDTREQMQRLNLVFWRFLVYELLFLWNTLDTCSAETLQKIVSDCANEVANEPIPGVAKLILASAEKLRGNSEKALIAYRDCLKLRRPLDEETVVDNESRFTHISAFANYKLAMLLLSSPATTASSTRDEAQQLLQTAQNRYKNYDFESRLSLRIHTAIKELNK